MVTWYTYGEDGNVPVVFQTQEEEDFMNWLFDFEEFCMEDED